MRRWFYLYAAAASCTSCFFETLVGNRQDNDRARAMQPLSSTWLESRWHQSICRCFLETRDSNGMCVCVTSAAAYRS